MSDVLVLGAGPCGLLAAMMIARDGHNVTVLDRDPAPPPLDPRDAPDRWERSTVPQFRQAHFMHARMRNVLDAELPEFKDALIAAGGRVVNQLSLPPFIEDREPRPGDERFVTVTARRQVLEATIAQLANEEPGLEIRRGVKVTSLETGAEVIAGTPHITGVMTEGGDRFIADLVVDAMGRRTPMPDLVQTVGARAPIVEAEDIGFTYYTRYFRSRDGTLPDGIGPSLSNIGSISCLTLPADNDTWFVVLFASSHDAPLKVLRHEDKWDAVLRAIPLQAHWGDGEPITPILPMSGVVDAIKKYVVDGEPVVTGMVPVADAWACTNPSLGRGISVGSMHAALLRRAIRSHIASPRDFIDSYWAETQREVEPWFRLQAQMDHARFADVQADIDGVERPPPSKDDPGYAFGVAAPHDPDLFRASTEFVTCLARPEELMARPGFVDRVLEVAKGKEPFQPPGPTRAELLALVS